MPNPIKELAKLTCRAKQIDGMGFGGGRTDNLEVAAILGMRNPNTGNKLDRKAYNFARFAYCDDKTARPYVKSSMQNILMKQDIGKISEHVLSKLIITALREFKHPATKINKDGAQEIESYSARRIARNVGLHHASITDKHKVLYGILCEQINIWSSEAYQHIKSHYDENEE